MDVLRRKRFSSQRHRDAEKEEEKNRTGYAGLDTSEVGDAKQGERRNEGGKRNGLIGARSGKKNTPQSCLCGAWSLRVVSCDARLSTCIAETSCHWVSELTRWA
jgi:hypothetical protein